MLQPLVMSSLLTVTPLTVNNVRPIFEKTQDLKQFCFQLNALFPHDKQKDAATAAEWYVSNATRTKSWRSVIYSLDWTGDTALAESIMNLAELHAGVWCVLIIASSSSNGYIPIAGMLAYIHSHVLYLHSTSISICYTS